MQAGEEAVVIVLTAQGPPQRVGLIAIALQVRTAAHEVAPAGGLRLFDGQQQHPAIGFDILAPPQRINDTPAPDLLVHPFGGHPFEKFGGAGGTPGGQGQGDGLVSPVT